MPIERAPVGGASEMEALYEDEPSEAPAPAEEPAEMPPTDVIDSKLLGGQTVKPGDRVILEVVSVNGNTVEVKYASEDEEPEMSEDDQLAELSQ